MDEDEKYFEILKLMVQKHQEQAELFYKRLNILVGVTTAIIGILTLFIARSSGYLKPEVIWIISSIIAIAALIITSIFDGILVDSLKWISFWRSKIQLLEHQEYKGTDSANKQHMFFFYDRLFSKHMDIEDRNHVSLDGGEVTKANNSLAQIWKSDTKNRGRGIGYSFKIFTQLIATLWLSTSLIFSFLIYIGFDPVAN